MVFKMGRQLFTTNMFVATLKRLRNTALQVNKKCVSQPTLITVFQGKWPFPFMVEVDTFRSKPFFLQCKRFRKSSVRFFLLFNEIIFFSFWTEPFFLHFAESFLCRRKTCFASERVPRTNIPTSRRPSRWNSPRSKDPIWQRYIGTHRSKFFNGIGLVLKDSVW